MVTGRKSKKKKKEKAPTPPTRIFDGNVYPNNHKKVYRLGRFLGKGSFGQVFELQSEDSGNIYAGKCIWKKNLVKTSQVKKVISEIEVHKNLVHPNIIRFHRYFEDNDFVYLILELCERETMVELLKKRIRLTEPEVRYYLLQVIEAVAYMHKNFIIHRDLKLGNVLIDRNMNIKIADFGLAKQLKNDEEKRTTICGTPNYIAPEVLSGSHSFEVDVWSIGCLTYTLLVGKPPFETGKLKDTYDRIMKQEYSFPPEVSTSSQAKSFVDKMLTNKASRRPSITQLKKDVFFLLYTPSILSPKTLKEPPVFPSAFAKTNVFKSPKSIKKRILGKRPSPYKHDQDRKRKKSSIDEILKELGEELQRSVVQESKEGKRGSTRECGESNSSSPQPHSTTSPEPGSDTEKSSQQRPNSAKSSKRNQKPATPPKQRSSTNSQPTNPIEEPVRILVWVLCKNHGLGYALSNGCFGVCFNDDTKIILQPDRKTYCYIDRGPYGNIMHHGTATITPTYRTERQKKVLILMKMYQHLNHNRTSLKFPKGNTALLQSQELIFVSRWRSTLRGTIIKLNNKVQYIKFAEGEVITLWNKSKITCELNAPDAEGRTNFKCSRDDLRSNHPKIWRRLVNLYTDQIKTQGAGQF